MPIVLSESLSNYGMACWPAVQAQLIADAVYNITEVYLVAKTLYCLLCSTV